MPKVVKEHKAIAKQNEREHKDVNYEISKKEEIKEVEKDEVLAAVIAEHPKEENNLSFERPTISQSSQRKKKKKSSEESKIIKESKDLSNP